MSLMALATKEESLWLQMSEIFRDTELQWKALNNAKF